MTDISLIPYLLVSGGSCNLTSFNRDIFMLRNYVVCALYHDVDVGFTRMTDMWLT